MEDFVDYESINRAAISIRPHQPFIEWINSVGDTDEITFDDVDAEIYLVPEFEDEEEMNDWFSENFDTLFCNQMNGWYMDTDVWIKDRTLEMFYVMFDVSYISMIWDTEAGDIEKA